MLRKLAILAALIASGTFAVPTFASVEITCGDDPPYAVWYTDGSGGGNRLVQCWGDQWASLTSQMNDSISSVQVFGPNTTGKVPCAYSNTYYAGNYYKAPVGQHGFTIFQWPYTGWTNNGAHADDQISSIKWCT